MAKSLKKELCVLGLSAGAIASSFALSGCSKRELTLAQQNIDNVAVNFINNNELCGETKFAGFTFLGADIENSDAGKYKVDINGVVVGKNKEKAYTTLNYSVNSSYFPAQTSEDKYTSNANLINMLSDIIKNEDLVSYSIISVGNVKNLNTNLAKVTSVDLSDDYKCAGNFLYSVNNLTFNENEHYASFSTKEFIKYSKTKVNYWAFTENGPIYTIDADNKDYFIKQNVYVELSPEELALAKTDSTIVFDKFAEYVDGAKSQNYVVEQTEISEAQEQGIVMNEEVSLSNI